jgi:hypothetical protein
LAPTFEAGVNADRAHPPAFAVAHPASDALPVAVLLISFIGTGSSFLAFAALAEKRGLTEAAESITSLSRIKNLHFFTGH